MRAIDALKYLLTSDDEDAVAWRETLSASEFAQHEETLRTLEDGTSSDSGSTVDRFLNGKREREASRSNALQTKFQHG